MLYGNGPYVDRCILYYASSNIRAPPFRSGHIVDPMNLPRSRFMLRSRHCQRLPGRTDRHFPQIGPRLLLSSVYPALAANRRGETPDVPSSRGKRTGIIDPGREGTHPASPTERDGSRGGPGADCRCGGKCPLCQARIRKPVVQARDHRSCRLKRKLGEKQD